MDFIIDLLFANGKDFIFVVVDRLTKDGSFYFMQQNCNKERDNQTIP
jgi:hypothetical protein